MPNRVSLQTEHCGNSPFLVSKDGTPGHGEQGSFHFRPEIETINTELLCEPIGLTLGYDLCCRCGRGYWP